MGAISYQTRLKKLRSLTTRVNDNKWNIWIHDIRFVTKWLELSKWFQFFWKLFQFFWKWFKSNSKIFEIFWKWFQIFWKWFQIVWNFSNFDSNPIPKYFGIFPTLLEMIPTFLEMFYIFFQIIRKIPKFFGNDDDIKMIENDKKWCKMTQNDV